MARTPGRTMTLAAGAAVTAALVVTLAPSGGSQARWRDGTSTSATGTSSDGFGMTATNVPDTAPMPWPSGRWANSPQITLANLSARHSSWTNVKSTRVAKVVTGDTNSVVAKVALDYTHGTGTCAAGGQGSYWSARATGQVVDGTTYPRSQAKVAGATIPPAQSRTLCPVVTLGYPSTTAGQRDALLNHAGRALDITAVVNQRSEAPATWASQDRTVVSRYRIATPAPAKPSTSDVCQRTFSNGTPSSAGYYGGFFWGWPDPATASTTATPAMAGGWEIMRRTRTGTWEVWKSIASGNERNLAGINSRDISDVRNEVREFKLRGYPFAGDRSRYVESAWIARAQNDWSLLTDRWTCESPLPNPDAGPQNMP